MATYREELRERNERKKNRGDRKKTDAVLAYPAFSADGWPKTTSAYAWPKTAHFGLGLAEATIFGPPPPDDTSSAQLRLISAYCWTKYPFRPSSGRKLPLRPQQGRQGHIFDILAMGTIVSELAIKKVIVLKKILDMRYAGRDIVEPSIFACVLDNVSYYY